jgi:hypothetical protein
LDFFRFGVRSAVDLLSFVVEFALITCLKQHAPFRVNCTEVSPHKLDTGPHTQLLKSASPQAALLKQRLDTTQCEYPPCGAESGESIQFSPQSQCHACVFRHSTITLLLSKSCSLHSYTCCHHHSCCQSISPLCKSHIMSLILQCYNSV